MNFDLTYGNGRLGFSIDDAFLPKELPLVAPRKVKVTPEMTDIDDTHSFGGRGVWAGDASRRKNPFSLGCYEARMLADSSCLEKDGKIVRRAIPTFGLDMISDARYIYWARSGDITEITREMAREADKLAAFEVSPAPYVVSVGEFTFLVIPVRLRRRDP